MDGDKLVHMANQIAGFFRSYPEQDAVVGVADHIKSFWTPGMRRTLTARLKDRQDGAEALVVRAILGPAANGQTSGDSPAGKALDGPRELGQVASDAG